MIADDRAAVISAINSTANLSDAARKLGASRRTLQNRMREYGLPRGKAGRPKKWLPYKSDSSIKTALGVGVAVVGLIFVRRWLRSKEHVGEL